MERHTGKLYFYDQSLSVITPRPSFTARLRDYHHPRYRWPPYGGPGDSSSYGIFRYRHDGSGLAEAGIPLSVGSRGDSDDGRRLNSPSFEWVAWSNNYRLLESIGYILPAGAEANYYRQLTDNTVDAI